MNVFLTLAFLFFIGSLIGWCIEVIFRKFFSNSNPEHKWINPGFLVGPYLPLYGFGLCILYLLASLEKYSFISNPVVNRIVLFVVMAIGMTLIEYIAGLIFIKGMNVKLWDYSDNWGNIQGIICPLFSFFWAVLGAVYYFFIHPYILNALAWLSRNLAFSFVIGFFFGVFILDFCYSAKVLAKIRKFAADNELIVKYDELREHIRKSRETRHEKSKFMFSFRSETPFSEQLRQYLDKVREKTQEVRKIRK